MADANVKDEGNEVVMEINVFINQQLAENLYIFQYPLRAATNPYPSTAEIKYKENAQYVQMTFPVPDPPGAEDLVQQVEKEKQKFSLTSTLQPMVATYAVAVHNGDEIHLTPLRSRVPQVEDAPIVEGAPPPVDRLDGGGILQFRRDFTDLNPPEILSEEKEAQKAEFKRVKVKYQTKKQERLQSLHKTSYSYKMKQLADEEWAPLTYLHYDDSFEPQEKLEQLLFNSTETDFDIPFTLPKSRYLDVLVGDAAKSESFDRTPYGVCSKAYRETLPLDPQLMELMRSAQIIPFSRIKELISLRMEDNVLIASLDKVAVQIRGNWIVKSGYCKSLRGDEQKVNVRDLLLLELYKHPEGVSRRSIAAMCTVNNDELKAIFSSVCNLDTTSKPPLWNMKYEGDADFQAKFPEVVTKSDQYWAEQDRKLTTIFMSGQVSSLDQFFISMFHEYGVCNIVFLKQKLKEKIDTGRYPNLQGFDDEKFRAKLTKLADNLHGGYFLRTVGDEILNGYRNIVIDAFKSKPTPALKKIDILEAAKAKINKPIPEKYYQIIMKELAYSTRGTWIFRSGNGKDI